MPPPAPPPAYSVFGRRLASDFPFRAPLSPGAPAAEPPDLVFRRVAEPLPDAAVDWSADAVARRLGADVGIGALGEDHVLRCDRGAVDFRLGRGGIVAHAPAAPDWLVELRLLGPVTAFWLEAVAGALTLHAAAAVVAGRAVAFLGGNGAGKTSLALALAAAGHPLLADDLVAVETADDGWPVVPPAYPFVRLLPDDAVRWTGDPGAAELPRVHPGFPKRIVPATAAAGRGGFAGAAARLAALVLPERGGGAPPRFQPLSPAAAAVELARHSATPRLFAAAGRGEERLARLAALCERVPAWRYAYPDGFDRLPEAADQLAARLAAA